MYAWMSTVTPVTQTRTAGAPLESTAPATGALPAPGGAAAPGWLVPVPSAETPVNQV